MKSKIEAIILVLRSAITLVGSLLVAKGIAAQGQVDQFVNVVVPVTELLMTIFRAVQLRRRKVPLASARPISRDFVMSKFKLGLALSSAVEAARAAGALMRRNARAKKKVNASSQHDIKLELDVRCQKLIERTLHRALPGIDLLGEEGESAAATADYRWVVDPIDGTVNFTYGIPHACVSIALQRRTRDASTKDHPDAAYDTVLGVVYDPFCDELWTAVEGGPARLNGRVIRVSRRPRLEESIVSIGFSKDRESLERMLPTFNRLVHRVRKVRIMGAAALALTYVASGRMDAYIEFGLSLWDIAAGGFIIERAGGEFWREPAKGEHKFRIIASNGLLGRTLKRLM